jgi:hypothetical protein
MQVLHGLVAMLGLSGFPSAPCGPTKGQLSRAFKVTEPTRQLTFFIHESGAFDFSKTRECFLSAVGAKRTNDSNTIIIDNLDELVLPGTAEVLDDLWLLERFRSHPARVMDPSKADLQVLGSELTISNFAGNLAHRFGLEEGKGPCGTETDHSRRVQDVAKVLKGLPEYRRKNGTDWLVINGHWHWRSVLVVPGIESRQGLKPSNAGDGLIGVPAAGRKPGLLEVGPAVFASVDRDAGQLIAEADNHNVDVLILPYKANSVLEQDAWIQKHAADANASATPLRTFRQTRFQTDFLFRGKFDRNREGEGRPVLGELAKLVPRTKVADVNFLSYHKGDWMEGWRPVMHETTNDFLHSTFCFAPAGDTPTSRRIYDSLAAGCIPVMMVKFEAIEHNLPFKHSIDWRKIALFAGSLDCITNKAKATARWMKDLVHRIKLDPTDVAQMRAAGRDAFRKYLSLSHPGSQIVDAVLTELSTRPQFGRGFNEASVAEQGPGEKLGKQMQRRKARRAFNNVLKPSSA